MRIVAIRTLHETFIDAVLAGHFKLRTNAGVTPVAQFRLSFGEEKLGRRRVMNGMAGRAGDIG